MKFSQIKKECGSCKKEFLVHFYRRQTAKFCSRSCSGKSKPNLFREKTMHPFWKGGKKEDRRNDCAYHIWRKSVYGRDNYQCRIRNNECKGRIEAHHILGWTNFPELRYEVNNGITLCHAHHPRKKSEEKRLSPYFKELVAVSKAKI